MSISLTLVSPLPGSNRCPLWGPHSGSWYTFKINEIHYHPHGFNIQLSVNSLPSQTRTSPSNTCPLMSHWGDKFITGPSFSGNQKPIPQGLSVLCCPLPPPSQPAGSAKSVHSVLSLLQHPPSAQATVTALTCDTTVASEPASSQRSLPKPRPAPMTSPESHCLSQPATTQPL